MRRIALMFVFSLVLFSCEENKTVPEEEYDLHGKGKAKTKYIYSSSSDNEPYAFNSFSYDENWNLIKELISDYPKPVYASYTYEYSEKGVLLDKKYKAIEGFNSPDQTESDFILLREYQYSYQENKKIEKEYRRNIYTDSTIYTYMNNLLISEYHNDLDEGICWSINYEYDRDNNLIKVTENPEGIYTVNSYEGSRITQAAIYDRNGSLKLENEFVYLKSEDRVIVESYYKGVYGDFLSEKTTYKDGNVIEYIKYHPTKPGEWFCYKYEYY